MFQLLAADRIRLEKSCRQFGEFLVREVLYAILELFQADLSCAATPNKILYTITRTVHAKTCFFE